jgi:DNA polymerase III subunit epsilon
MGNRIIVLDFETTGLSPDWGDRATEVAAVLVEDGRIVDRYQSLMNAGIPIPRFIQELTGITTAMIRSAPSPVKVMGELVEFVGVVPIVAHNAAFDRKFYDAELARIGAARRQDFICSLRVARRVYRDAPDHKLGSLARHAAIKVSGRAHRALADATTTAELWLRMLARLKETYQLSDVPLDLMQRLQSVPKDRVDQFMAKYETKGDRRSAR